MPKVEYIHKGFMENGKATFDRPEMFQEKVKQLEGKRFEMMLEPEYEPISKSQRAYYFGGIIKAELMNSNAFAGLSEREIHQILLKQLRSYHRTIKTNSGDEISVEFVDDFARFSKEEMATYVDEVINFLAMEFSITVKTPDEYKVNQYLKS